MTKEEKIDYAAKWIEGYLLDGEGMNIPLEFQRPLFRTVAEQMHEFFTADKDA
jgi:hypothetical protein